MENKIDENDALSGIGKIFDQSESVSIQLIITPSSKYPLLKVSNDEIEDVKELYKILEDIRKLNVEFDGIRKDLYSYDDSKKANLPKDLKAKIKKILTKGKKYKNQIGEEAFIIKKYTTTDSQTFLEIKTIYETYLKEVLKLANMIDLLERLYYGKNESETWIVF